MQTHEDRDFQDAAMKKLWEKEKSFDMQRLEQRANQMVKDKQSEITAGKSDEEVIEEFENNGVSVKRLPDDEQGVLRISIGGGVKDYPRMNYCVFRGDPSKCIDLLRKTLMALTNVK